MKFLGYLRIQKLLCQDDQKDIFMERNATVFAELIQSLDGRSLSLIMREARDNGCQALRILCEHYLSKGKPKIIALYTELTALRRRENESVTNYIIRAENVTNALKISDGLLIAMVLKGLPATFKPFTTVITQKDKNLTFTEFKIALRSYEETEKMRNPPNQGNNVMQLRRSFKKFRK